VGPRAGLDGRKISSPPGFEPGPSSPYSVAISTELPDPRMVLAEHMQKQPVNAGHRQYNLSPESLLTEEHYNLFLR